MTEMTPEDLPEASESLDQLQPEDTLEDRGVDDILDEGISPPEAYRGEGFGTTADEALEGESFDQRLAQELQANQTIASLLAVHIYSKAATKDRKNKDILRRIVQ